MIKPTHFVESTEYRELHDFAGEPVEFVRRIFTGRTTVVHTGDACRRGRVAISVHRQDHFHVNVQRREWVAESK